MGAGKSHVINWMSDQGYFPLPDIVQALDNPQLNPRPQPPDPKPCNLNPKPRNLNPKP